VAQAGVPQRPVLAEHRDRLVVDLGVDPGQPAETIEGVADAEARKAGEIIEDDGKAVDRIIQVLAEAKVV